MSKNTNQTPKPNKRKLSTTDIVLMCLGIFILIRTPWSNMNSFFYLLFFLYIFCIMMRITNLRKQYAKKEEMAKKNVEEERENNALENKGAAELSANENAPEAEQSPPNQETTNTQDNPPS